MTHQQCSVPKTKPAVTADHPFPLPVAALQRQILSIGEGTAPIIHPNIPWIGPAPSQAARSFIVLPLSYEGHPLLSLLWSRSIGGISAGLGSVGWLRQWHLRILCRPTLLNGSHSAQQGSKREANHHVHEGYWASEAQNACEQKTAQVLSMVLIFVAGNSAETYSLKPECREDATHPQRECTPTSGIHWGEAVQLSWLDSLHSHTFLHWCWHCTTTSPIPERSLGIEATDTLPTSLWLLSVSLMGYGQGSSYLPPRLCSKPPLISCRSRLVPRLIS